MGESIASCRFGKIPRRSTLIFLTFILCNLVLVIRHSNGPPRIEPTKNLQIYPETIQVACFCNTSYPLLNLVSLIEGIIDESEDLKVNFNVLVLNKDRELYGQALLALRNSVPVDRNIRMSYNIISLDPITERYAEKIKEMRAYYCHPICWYTDDMYYLRALHHLIFPSFTKLIALDADLDFRIDLRELYEQFELMDGKKTIAMSPDQTPYYRIALEEFRKRNPRTKIGEPQPEGYQGLNAGLILLDLQKLRESDAFQYYLSTNGAKFLKEKYQMNVSIGDQDFFTLLGADNPGMFHFLDCSWNRQVSMIYKNHERFDDYHKCDRAVKIYHGNGGANIPQP